MTEIQRYAAFTADPRGGNPAGIVLDARGLSDPEMLAIAAGVGYSETAFIVSPEPPPPPPRHLGGPSKAAGYDNPGGPSTYRVRYFSPEIEVPFCGHATIATAVALGPGEHVFTTNAGDVPITVDEHGRATLTSVPASVDDLEAGDLSALLKALHYTDFDLDESLPPKVAYAGAHHPVIALGTRAKLAALDYDVDALKQLMTANGWTTIQLIFRATDDTFDVRNPFPVGGVYEDPATGAAAAALGAYLRELWVVPDDAVLNLRQGDDMGRPSRITVTLTPGDDRVRVSGTAVPITG
ncbi:PhzF family phenazine biosynthesis isomerase [Actinoplanes sp. NPDC051411]|uniref:PhzF family phenazine biosynthesis protein n=1 Tax=Actinoplanes sp. NPDC051411 TaxID=3155522 RepID=UPI003417FCC4